MYFNKNDCKEILNLLIRVRNMKIILNLIRNIFSSVVRRLYRNSKHISNQSYPIRVKDLSKKISIKSSNSTIILNPNIFFKDKTIKLKLAKGFIEFSNKPIWNKNYCGIRALY